MIKQKLLVLLAAPALSLVLAQAQPQLEVFPHGGHLGVQIRDVTSDDVQSLRLPRELGVYVEAVEEGSPAEQAGLQERDVIREFSGVPVISVVQFRRLVAETPAGREVDLRIVRDGNDLGKTATLDQRPVDRRPGRAFGLRLPRGAEDFHLELPEFEWRGDGSGRGMVIGPTRPRLGIQGVELGEQMAQFLGVPGTSGVLVLEVRQGSPAEKAGLRAGDVITGVNGKNIASLAELSGSVRDGTADLEIIRDRQRQSLKITVEQQRRRESSGESRRL